MKAAFPFNMCARVWFKAEWTSDGRSVSVSFREFAVVELSINGLYEGCSLPVVG